MVVKVNVIEPRDTMKVAGGIFNKEEDKILSFFFHGGP